METKTKVLTIGGAIIALLVGMMIISFPNAGISLKFFNDRTEFYVNNNTLAGVESVYLCDNPTYTLSNSNSKQLSISRFTRTIKCSDDSSVTAFYLFNDKADVKELIPLDEKYTIKKAKGKEFRYIITNISYNGETKDIQSGFGFGNNMKLEWKETPKSAKVFSDGYIVLIFDVTKSNQVFNIRLFDPITDNSIFVTNTTILRRNGDKINVSVYINISNSTGTGFANQSNATFRTYFPNGTLYQILQIPSPYNNVRYSVVYNYSALSTIQNGTWTVIFNMTGNYNATRLVSFGVSENHPTNNYFYLYVPFVYSSMNSYIYSIEFSDIGLFNATVLSYIIPNTSFNITTGNYIVSQYQSSTDYYVKESLGYPYRLPYPVNRSYSIPFIIYNGGNASNQGACFVLNVTNQIRASGYNFTPINTSYVLNLFDTYGNYIQSLPFKTSDSGCS